MIKFFDNTAIALVTNKLNNKTTKLFLIKKIREVFY